MSTTYERAVLGATPDVVFARLPDLGRVMCAMGFDGARHERLGEVGKVEIAGRDIVIGGSNHDTRIDPTAVGSLIVDRTIGRGGRIFPRIEVHGHDDELLMSVIGLGTFEEFDAGLAGIAEQPIPTKTVEQLPIREPEEDDPGAGPLRRANMSGIEIFVESRRPGIVQSWCGVMPEVRPGRGFINVARPDFHIHLRAGAVDGWAETDIGNGIVELAARGSAGSGLNLYLRGPAAAFSHRHPLPSA